MKGSTMNITSQAKTPLQQFEYDFYMLLLKTKIEPWIFCELHDIKLEDLQTPDRDVQAKMRQFVIEMKGVENFWR